MEISYRKMTLSDIGQAVEIINRHANEGLMLEKTHVNLLVCLPNFFVAVTNNGVVGVCGLKIWPTGDAEIISSCVIEDYHGQGVGKHLNNLTLAFAKELGLSRVFLLTTQVDFYKKIGFVVVSKQALGFKVYSDCLHCRRNKKDDPEFAFTKDCPDTAMLKTL